MKKYKTIGLSLGAITVLAIPAAVSISCGSQDQKPTTHDVTIDVTNLSVDKTIDAMVKALHVNMDAIGANEDAWTISDDMDKIKQYMNQIDVNKSIILKNGNDTYTMDFRPIQQWVDKIKVAASMENNPNSSATTATQIGLALTHYGMPEIAAVTGEAISMQAGLDMQEFMTLSTDDYNTMSDKNAFFDNHGYIQMLNAYHIILWDFVNSNFYDNWIQNKTFTLLRDGNLIIATPGTEYDDSEPADFGITRPPVHVPGPSMQVTNFETEFGLRLLNGFAYNRRTNHNPLAAYGIAQLPVIDILDSSYAFDQTKWNSFTDTYVDFKTISYSADAFGIPNFQLPDGWKKVDLYNNPFDQKPNPNFAATVGNVELNDENAFLLRDTLYYKP